VTMKIDWVENGMGAGEAREMVFSKVGEKGGQRSADSESSGRGNSQMRTKATSVPKAKGGRVKGGRPTNKKDPGEGNWMMGQGKAYCGKEHWQFTGAKG